MEQITFTTPDDDKDDSAIIFKGRDANDPRKATHVLRRSSADRGSFVRRTTRPHARRSYGSVYDRFIMPTELSLFTNWEPTVNKGNKFVALDTETPVTAPTPPVPPFYDCQKGQRSGQ